MTGRAQRRILIITPQPPEPPYSGFAIRVRELMRELSRRHSVTLVSYAWPWEEASVKALKHLCESVHSVAPTWPEGADRRGQVRSLLSSQPHSFRRLATASMQAAVEDLITRNRYDIAQVESSHLSGLDLSHANATVLDEHNIEYELLARSVQVERDLARKAYGLVEYVKVRRAERRSWQVFDGCVVTSEREIPEVRPFTRDRLLAVVPNGVDVAHFAPREPVATSGLVFTGLMRYRPNIDAVIYFVKEVLPRIHRVRPEVTFTIVGWGVTDDVRAILGPKVVSTGQVPDVRPYLAGAAAVVAPIRMGGGTRLKVLEALAAAKPLVSTSLACEGLDLVDGQHLLIADDPQPFADQVLRVLADRALGETLGMAGRAMVASRYGWDSSVAKLEELHEKVITAKNGGPKTSIAFGASDPATVVGALASQPHDLRRTT